MKPIIFSDLDDILLMPDPQDRGTVYGYPTSLNHTLIFLLIFVVALFPPVFNFAWQLPFKTVGYLFSSRSTSTAVIPTTTSIASCLSICPSVTATPNIATMSWFQKTLALPAKSRGSYLVTDEIVKQLPELKQYKVGILHLFIQHTSAALSMNENWDSDVREDMSDALDRIAPEDRKGNLYRHSAEGPDDMPAHIKSALVGSSVTIPITDGRLSTGTWQGIWYLEFRTSKHNRKIVATIQGEKA